MANEIERRYGAQGTPSLTRFTAGNILVPYRVTIEMPGETRGDDRVLLVREMYLRNEKAVYASCIQQPCNVPKNILTHILPEG